MTEALLLNMTPEMKAQLSIAAGFAGLSMSGFIRASVAAAMDEYGAREPMVKKALDNAERIVSESNARAAKAVAN